MHKLVLVFLSLLSWPFIHVACAAGNLVTNYSFETYSSCPTCYSTPAQNELPKATGWLRPTTGTPDFYHQCNNTVYCMLCTCWGPAGVPNNWTGSQSARTGVGYTGLYAWEADVLNLPQGINYREYLQYQLSASLVGGLTYDVSFYVSLADDCEYATDQVQAYLSSSAPGSGNNAPLSSLTPQISSPAGSWLNNKSGWTLVSGTYTAGGGERYITIGNFESDAAISINSLPGGNPGMYAYYYIDDVCVVLSGGSCIPALPVEIVSFRAGRLENGSVQLEWNTLSERNNTSFTVERSSDMLDFSLLATLEGAGNSTSEKQYSHPDNDPLPGHNYYRLLQTDADGNTTVFQEIAYVNIPSEEHAKDIYSVQDGKLRIKLLPYYGTGETGVSISLLTAAGRTVLEKDLHACAATSHIYEIDIQMLQHGIYFLRLKAGEQRHIEKIIVP